MGSERKEFPEVDDIILDLDEDSSDEIILEETPDQQDSVDDIILDEADAEPEIVLDEVTEDPEIILEEVTEEPEIILEEVDEGVISLLASSELDELVLDPTEDDLEEDDDTLVREGTQTDPKQSLYRILEFLKRRVEVLERSMVGSNVSGQDSDITKELISSIINSKSVGFLTNRDKAYLLSLIEELRTEEEVIKYFLQGRNLNDREILELTTYVRNISNRYENLTQKSKLLTEIRESVTRIILKEFMEEPLNYLRSMANVLVQGEVAYVKWVKDGLESSEFECSKCNTVNTSDSPFFKIMVSERNFSRNEYIVLFPLFKQCSNCNTLNIFSFEEYQTLNSRFNSMYKDVIYEWRNGSKLASYGNLISYKFNKDLLASLKSDVYLRAEEEVFEEKEDVGFSVELIEQWYKETLSLVSSFDKPYSGKSKHRGFSVEDSRIVIDYQDMWENLNNLCKEYCMIFREDYTSVKESAINSVLMYLRENPTLLNSMSYDPIYKLEALIMLKGYVGSDISEYDYNYVFNVLGKSFDLDVSKYYGDDNKFNVNLLQEFFDEINKKAEEFERELKPSRDSLSEVIDDLGKLIPLYRFIDLRQSNPINLEEFNSVLSNPQVMEWVDRVSTLMVIHKISDKILSYWKTLRVFTINNAREIKETPARPFHGRIESIIKSYNTYFRERGSGTSPIPFLDNFLSRNPIPADVMNIIDSLKMSIEKVDYYTFAHTVIDLEGKFIPVGAPYEKLKSLLSEYLEECKKFCAEVDAQSKGDRILDFYLYHYGHLFTEEEIREGIINIYDFIKMPFWVDREESESFVDYLNRIQEIVYDDKYCYRDKDANKFKTIYKYVPQVYGLANLCDFIRAGWENVREILFINDLVYHSYFYGSKFMYELLGLSGMKLDWEDPIDRIKDNVPDSEDYRIRFILKNLVYPSDEYNEMAEDDYGISEMLKQISEEREVFSNNFKYFGNFGGHLDKYYTS